MSLYKNLPNELIYDFIFPFIPCFELTRSILRLQKKRIFLIKYIKNFLSMDDIPSLRKYILKNYQGEHNFYYEDENTFLYCNLLSKNDFIYLIN